MNRISKRQRAGAAGRGARRRAAFLAAAREAFLAKGYAAATLDDVVRRSGGSRATLYKQFGDKAGLFAAIIAELCAEMTAPLREAGERPQARAPRAALLAFATAFMRVMMAPASLALYRLVVAEAGRFPELGRAVYRAGPKVAAARLAAYLRAGAAAGAFTAGDADLRARHFLEMVKGDLHFRALIGLGPQPSRREVDRCVRAAVDSLLNGISARPPSRASARRRRRAAAARGAS
ncbi:MAG: TetR/AcrR family transcriptional regulator [Xanthobacteraceae bacterium]|nr:TetR/AcrR family transcriptional regulator [Xanthobacteraceae bacterium]